MKKQTFLKTILSALCVTLLLSACKKSGGGNNGQNSSGDVMYPATLSFYEGNNSTYPSVSTFKYDSKHLLTWFGNKDRFTNVAPAGVEQVIYGGHDTTVNYYLYDGNIYTGSGLHTATMHYSYKAWELPPTIGPENKYSFNDLVASHNVLGYANLGKYSQYFVHDKDGNLTSSKFVTNAWGSPNSSQFDPGGLEYVRISYSGFDNKPSPYSAVDGYQFISFLWAYPWQFYFALSKHNPSHIEEEDLDTNTMKWSIYSKSDLSYTYNEQGYPSQVKITTTYPSSGTPGQAFYQTYDFTYMK